MRKLWNSLRSFQVIVFFFVICAHLNYLSGNICIPSVHKSKRSYLFYLCLYLQTPITSSIHSLITQYIYRTLAGFCVLPQHQGDSSAHRCDRV